jgi:hypothetical protein
LVNIKSTLFVENFGRIAGALISRVSTPIKADNIFINNTGYVNVIAFDTIFDFERPYLETERIKPPEQHDSYLLPPSTMKIFQSGRLLENNRYLILFS